MKMLKRALCVCFLLMFSMCLTACDGGAITCKNGHAIKDSWHSDSTSHYAMCEKCGDVVKHDHNLQWKVTAEASGTLSEIKSEYCADCGYLTGRTDSLDTWNGVSYTKGSVFASKISASSYTDSKGRAFNSVSVNTASDLITAFNELDDHKNFTIKLTGDIDLSAGDWTSAYIDGITNGDIEIIIDGNYHTIIGLNNPLIGRVSTGGTKIVIRNLYIEKANINTEESAGALIATATGASSIVIDGCELIDSSVVGNECIGGLIGSTGGNSGVYSQIFENVEIKNCSISDSSIGGDGVVGAVIGRATNDAWTKVTISDCAIVNNRITSTSSNSDYAGVVVGSVGVAGTAKKVGSTTLQGGTYLLNIVQSENSVISYTSYIERLYGCQGETTAQLYVDGVQQF